MFCHKKGFGVQQLTMFINNCFFFFGIFVCLFHFQLIHLYSNILLEVFDTEWGNK